MLNQLNLRQALNRTAGPLGLIGAVGGFISDVMAPLGSIAFWVAALSFVIFLGTIVAFFRMRNQPGVQVGETVMPAVMVLAAGSTIIFAVWAGVIANGPDNGYLADNVDGIAQLQASLLNLEEDIAEIQETTAETAEQVDAVATVASDTQETTDEIQDTVEDTAVNVEQIATAQAQGFDDIQDAFATLLANQTLVENPETPQEWYSNARLYQQRGDTTNAIAAYEGYFQYELEFVDPYYEYSNLLRATEGVARTRQIINDQLNERPDSETLDLMAALLLDTNEETVERLELLAQRAPQFGPVFYELGEVYTSQLRENFTQNLLEKQDTAVTTLNTLEQTQQFSSFYIDKSLAQQNLADLQDDYDSFQNASAFDLFFLAFYTYEGVTITVVLPEGNVQELRFSHDDPNPVNATGSSNFGGQNVPNSSIGPIPLEKGDHTLYVQYTDATGVESEIFTFDYTVEDIVINYQQQPFDFSANGIPVIFTLAVVDAADPSGLYTYNYSLDDPSLDQSVQGVAQAGVIQISPVEAGEHVLYLQAVGADGTETEVIEYEFEVEG